MANMSENEKTLDPGWEIECTKAARDRVRRRLGDAARQREEAALLQFRRSRGKVPPPAEDDVIALRFSEEDHDRKLRRHR